MFVENTDLYFKASVPGSVKAFPLKMRKTRRTPADSMLETVYELNQKVLGKEV